MEIVIAYDTGYTSALEKATIATGIFETMLSDHIENHMEE